MDNQQRIIGAIKIKDGLFIGDEYAAQDLEFVVTNKVTHIINCAGQNIGNVWEQIGVMYLTFPWTQSDQQQDNLNKIFKTQVQFNPQRKILLYYIITNSNYIALIYLLIKQVLFDEQDEILNEIVKFIDEAAEVGESTLVHSIKGQSRACCVLAAYFMKKYNWALLKTLEFLNSRRPELEIRSSFFNQLTNLSQKLQNSGTGAMIQDWHDTSYNNNGAVQVEQLIIRNTFLNSRNAPIADIFQDEKLQMQMISKEKKDKLTWNDIHHNRELHVAVIPNPNTFNPIQHYRQSSLNKKVIKPCLKQKSSMPRSMSGNQVGAIGPSLKYNKSAKCLVEDTPQVGNQHSFLLNSSLQKTDLSSSNNISNCNFYSNNNSNQINQNSSQSNQLLGINSQQQNSIKGNPFYQQQQTQSYGQSQIQSSSFQQQQPLLSQQIRNLQQQLPNQNQMSQPNQVGINSQSLNQDRQSIQSQQYQQINSYQQHNNINSSLQPLGNNTYSNNNFINNTNLNNYQNNNMNSVINNSTTNIHSNNSTNINNQNNNPNINNFINENNKAYNPYSNENKNINLNIPSSMSNNAQQIKNQNQSLIKTLNSTSTSSKNATSSFQNALTLNSGNSGSKSISQSALNSPYSQKNIANILSNTINDKKSNGSGSANNSGSKHNNKMMPPQSASMQEKKQNIISKILEQQQPSLSSSTNTSASNMIRSNSLRAFENEKDQLSSKQNNLSAKSTIQTYLNPSIENKANPYNQSSNTSSNTSILQKNNTSFGSQLGNDQSTASGANNLISNQTLSTQVQSGYRSNSLPKRLEDERSPSSKLSYQQQTSNRPSSLSTKEKQDNPLQYQKNQFSFLNNEMKNSQIQQNGMEKPRFQPGYSRASSANNDQEQNNTSYKPSSDHLSLSSQNKQTPSSILGIKSPVSSTKAGYTKNERPPLKPRDMQQNSITSTTNNTVSTVNTSLSKSFQQSTLSKLNANSNVHSSQTSNSDSNRYSTNTLNQFTNSINTSSIGSNQDLKVVPSSSSLTQAISNKFSNNTNNSLINSDSNRGNSNRYNNIPLSTSNKSPINGGPSTKSSLTSKPPQSKPQQSFDKSLKENYNIQPYSVYQPMQNNFMDSQKHSENININTPSSLIKPNIGKTTPSYRSFSPDIQSLQNKLDKQKQIGSSKNRIRSNSPGQALSYNINNTSNTSFNQISSIGNQNVFADQKIDYLKQQNNLNAISSESDNIFTLTNGLFNSNISSSKPRWKF